VERRLLLKKIVLFSKVQQAIIAVRYWDEKDAMSSIAGIMGNGATWYQKG
jgi:hypothetical protein